MVRALKTLLGVVVVLAGIAAPIAFAFHFQAQTRNFHVVREGVLYRSGQTTLFGLKSLLHDYGIRTVVTLRDSYVPERTPPDAKEEAYCLKEGIRYVRIPPRHWEAPDGSAPADQGVKTFREVMDDRDNYPVLVHCFAGIHRTGAYCAVYRMEYQHWSNADAIAEMEAAGYENLPEEWAILHYLDRYRPGWKTADPTSDAVRSVKGDHRPDRPSPQR
jgi:protein tyrosine phosphatase (PTP) superfamily phosphohydrolase (DUF442 family)